MSIAVRHLQKNFDSAAILVCMAKVAWNAHALQQQDHLVLEAIRRADPQLADASLTEIGERLAALDDAQIAGYANNVKGILHEMAFVELENSDGDSLFASMYTETNHPDTDVRLFDMDTQEAWSVQLKASDQAAYVQDWLDQHPDGDIVITDELASQLDLPSSGLENAKLTANVDDVIDRLIETGDGINLWPHVPYLTGMSLALALWQLKQRQVRGDIDASQFQRIAIKLSGWKLAKFALIALLLAIPGVNIVTGAALVSSLILGLTRGVTSTTIRSTFTQKTSRALHSSGNGNSTRRRLDHFD